MSVIFFFKLRVNVTNLPPKEANNSYKCLIDGKERPTSTLPGGKLACRTPTSDQLPKIKSDTGIGASDLGGVLHPEDQPFTLSYTMTKKLRLSYTF